VIVIFCVSLVHLLCHHGKRKLLERYDWMALFDGCFVASFYRDFSGSWGE
jgi:hypothetical protein